MSNTVADWTLQGLLLLQQVAPPASNVCFLEQAILERYRSAYHTYSYIINSLV
jgi:hypothetical protein